MWKRIIGLSLIVIGSLGLLKAVTKKNKQSVQFEEGAHNLALRQVAHKLYLLEGDSTSRISPVLNINDSTFQIQIKKELKYSALPLLIGEAIKDYNLNSEYIVAVKDCKEEKVVLGYNSVAVINTDIPCGSREHILDCSYLSVTFLAKKQEANFNSLLFSGLLLIGLTVFLLTLVRKTKKSIFIDPLKESKKENTLISLGSFAFDPLNQTISLQTESKSLTFRENKLLKYMCDNINNVIKRDDIMANVWEEEGVIVGRSLDVFISRLRKILKEDPSIQIKSVHGVGYRLVVE